jgi:tRNA pseudouridine32 synthase/23S rRNA pseudouridine746 synthase
MLPTLMNRPEETSRLDIVHQSDGFVVVNKPSGFLSVPGKGPEKQDCVVSRVREVFPDAEGSITIHRLDMDTSGLIVCALTKKAQRFIASQFEQRTTTKQYIALIDRPPAAETGTIEFPIRPDIDNRPHQMFDPVHGKPSTTNYRVLAHETDRTRVLFTPITGRSHQIRVHAAFPQGLGSPILGDPLYGDPSSAPRLMLHAAQLSFIEPGTDRRITFDSPVPF